MSKITIFFLLFTLCVTIETTIFTNIKSGECPPLVEVGICSLKCKRDYHCKGELKCCRTSCGGAICSRPVTSRVPTERKIKKGFCPSQPTGPWVCTSRCTYDSDCRGSKKCCKNRCGAMACTKPEDDY